MSRIDRWPSTNPSRSFFLRPPPKFFFPLSLNPVSSPHPPSPPPHNSKKKQGYREDAGLFLESDTDEQLLINIPFTQGKER